MSDPDDYHVRWAIPADLPAITELMASYDMVGDITADECLVAVADRVLSGFARVELASGVPYLRPIVVAKDYHGRGVGRSLLQTLLNKFPALRLVARGDAAGFYARFGYVPCSWADVYPPYTSECQHCPDLASCQPVPMSREVTS